MKNVTPALDRRNYGGGDEDMDQEGAPSDIEKRLESLITRLGERVRDRLC